jgi:hypothetical protein
MDIAPVPPHLPNDDGVAWLQRDVLLQMLLVRDIVVVEFVRLLSAILVSHD